MHYIIVSFALFCIHLVLHEMVKVHKYLDIFHRSNQLSKREGAVVCYKNFLPLKLIDIKSQKADNFD